MKKEERKTILFCQANNIFCYQLLNLCASSVATLRSSFCSSISNKTRHNPFAVTINRYSFVLTKRRNHCAGQGRLGIEIGCSAMHKKLCPAKHNSRHANISDSSKNTPHFANKNLQILLGRFVRKWVKAKAKLCGCDNDLSMCKKTTA